MILEPADMHRALASHDAEPSPALVVVQELILAQDNLGIDPGDALYAARTLLAAHARELAATVAESVRADRERWPAMGDNGCNNNHRDGMQHIERDLNRYADDLEAAAAGAR